MRSWGIGAGALLAIGLLSGCGPKYGMRVPSEMVARLPYETRIELLEAENQLAVAVDKVDEAENEIDRTRAGIRRAKRQADAADDQIDDAKDATSKEVARLAKDEAESRIEYLRARQGLNDHRRESAELALRCAHARFEVARLQAATKAKVEGAHELDAKDFDGQVKDCEKELAELRGEEKPAQTELQTAQASWEKRKEALAQKTFAARASPYVE
jgi:hypothetical protein